MTGQGRVIFTQDDDFLVLGRQACPMPVAYCQQYSSSIGQIIRALELIWSFVSRTRWRMDRVY